MLHYKAITFRNKQTDLKAVSTGEETEISLLVFSSLFVLVVMSPDEWLKKITIMPYNYGLKYTHTGKNELKLWLTEIHLVWLSMVMTLMFPNGQNRKKMNRWSQQF